jgi:hypothetical protein
VIGLIAQKKPPAKARGLFCFHEYTCLVGGLRATTGAEVCMRSIFRVQSLLKFVVAASAVWAMSACSETAATGEPVAIPQVDVNCSFFECKRSPAETPRINLIITTSGCSAPEFGATVASGTQSQICNSSGCHTSLTSWVDVNGNPAATLPSGTYSVCGCVDFAPYGTPFVNCEAEGELNNVSIGQNTLPIDLNYWH